MRKREKTLGNSTTSENHEWDEFWAEWDQELFEELIEKVIPLAS
jgi:hypothetical protein